MAILRSFAIKFFNAVAALCANAAILLLFVAVLGYGQLREIDAQLPDIQVLRHAQFQAPLSIYSRDGLLIAEFGDKKTIPATLDEIPAQLVNAFLAAEDDSFNAHPGVDYKGLLRAAWQYLKTGKKKQGGSTITMQVSRNFFLSREKTFIRKIKEILLSFKIEREFDKKSILELYLNKIYLGQHAYGVMAAAQMYYGKPPGQLTLAENAMLAGLPKAPSEYNPVADPEKALQRRNYVLSRMLELGLISQADYKVASASPNTAQLHLPEPEVDAPYVAEMVRQEVFARFGDAAYTQGLKVYTTLDGRLQAAANRAIRLTLHEYDERHGYRKASHVPNKALADLQNYSPVGDTWSALVTKLDDKELSVALPDQSQVSIPIKKLRWARTALPGGNSAKRDGSNAAIKPNDIVRLRKMPDDSWTLAQVPEVEGALVALDTHNGAILALNGGFDFYRSKYNRATQSKRQPGSGFKPVIYTAALEHGYGPGSIINDAPLVLPGATQNQAWRPGNYGNDFLGPISLRTALAKSRNLVSIRLLIGVGLDRTIETAQRLGFRPEQLPHSYTLALGSGYASPLEMARLYAVFANGGFRVEPYLIERIQTGDGAVLFQAKPQVACPQCGDVLPQPPGLAPRAISPQVNFLMNSLLRDVVNRGTATAAKVLGRTDLAGKTGTTNDERDAWFNGFVPSLAVTTWVGYDSMRPLGDKETGGHTALPMWVHFMREALQGVPETPLQAPEGVVKRLVSYADGSPVASTGGEVWEYALANSGARDMASEPSPESEAELPADAAEDAQKVIESLF